MAFCAAVVAFAGGCAVPSSSISSDSRPDPKLAYVYGRFFVHAEGKPGGLSSYPTIGMVIGCGHQQYEYTIRFLNTRDTVQLVPIYPGRCALMRMWRSDENGIPRGGGDLVPASPPFFDFEAGTAYYLGDYFAHAGIDYTYRNDRLKRYRAWDMDPADGRYQSTTADMKRTFPWFARWHTEEALLVPPRRTTKPGLVVIDDPGEPLMTPERIARVAPFVQRTFGSPAECERACPTGQCLPFRGESGPAMTCINRCKTDKDCPTGLACNCPDGGADCQPIAEAPGDRMAKICLPTETAGQRPGEETTK
jgi:hypothetical protein